jgi:hypothetical protein
LTVSTYRVLSTVSGFKLSALHLLSGTDFFPAPGLMAYADKMLHGKFDGDKGFTIDGGIKDAG